MRSSLSPVAAAIGALLLAGCGASLDQVRAEPVRLTVPTPVAYDTMANCLAARSSQVYAVTPLVFPREGKATVTLAAKTTDSIQAEYSVRRAGDGSVVEWRRRQLVGNDIGGMQADAQETIERCSKV